MKFESRYSLLVFSGVLFLFLLYTVAPAVSESTGGEHFPLYEDLSQERLNVTTKSERAQAYFNQGLQLAYGFARAEAARSFRVAQQYDSECAMCFWGEAWVLGPYQNNPGGVGKQSAAYEAAQKALEQAKGVEGWELALIEAMAVRYAGPGEDEEPEVTHKRYAEAMRSVATNHPDNLDIRTLYAESVMMLRPWNLYRDDGTPYPETQDVIKELEAILSENLEHSGACHLYIHTVEPYEPKRAEACADRLADGIPDVSHIQHMPSHVYMHIGRYGDSVRANQKARLVDQKARHTKGFRVYPSHNTGMLVYSAWMDGQSGVALSAARDLAKEHSAESFQQYLILARFGRWDEILEQDSQPEDAFKVAMWRFARGLARLRSGDKPAVDNALDQIRTIRGNIPEDAYFYPPFFHSQRDLIGIAENILAGELAAVRGRYSRSVEYLNEAIRLEDELPYSEPEPWPIPARHVLGAVLLEAGQPVKAESVYREALEIHPENGWSLKGLQKSLEAQGKSSEAWRVEQRFEESWKRADVWLRGSRF